ncbi:hypothetical protein SAMN04488001_0626 [Litoreibacter albidus]|uniref:Uncharacterized protein n=1 Tax=Litoreibacter albidus TaxID=670155 RepID=A0A1H2RYF1_9RHOB|nr:hypothetical protein SAMN04488001_0626 [Litoreibacter albidus]
MEFATELLGLLTAALMAFGAMPVFKKIADVEMVDIGVVSAVRESN